MLTRILAFVCRVCPLCMAARRWQGSWVARLVRWYSPACPFCRAYRKLHAAVPSPPAEPPAAV